MQKASKKRHFSKFTEDDEEQEVQRPTKRKLKMTEDDSPLPKDKKSTFKDKKKSESSQHSNLNLEEGISKGIVKKVKASQNSIISGDQRLSQKEDKKVKLNSSKKDGQPNLASDKKKKLS